MEQVSEKAQQAGLEISLRIGQRVRHQDYQGKRVTGVVRGLSIDSDNVLCADIALDEAIVFPPINEDERELRIYRQYVPVHELSAFDERDQVIEALLAELQHLAALPDSASPEYVRNHAAAAIAKATP